MDKNIIDRVNNEASTMIETKYTIREIAKLFKISKSTVHKDLNERLKIIDNDKYDKVKSIFDEHIKLRHIRGGLSTKRKYSKTI